MEVLNPGNLTLIEIRIFGEVKLTLMNQMIYLLAALKTFANFFKLTFIKQRLFAWHKEDCFTLKTVIISFGGLQKNLNRDG